MNIEARFRALDAHIERGTLIRNDWGDGQERACLLLAIAPEVGSEGDVAACPADLIPPWLAELTPLIDDNGTAAAWPAMIRRYSRVVRLGAERLDAAGWRRVLARFLIFCLERVARLDPSGSCVRVAALWRRVFAGDEPTQQDWEAAWAEARAAAEAARAAAEARAAEWDATTTALLDAIEEECA